MCSGHSHSHGTEMNETIARKQGAEMAELDLLWALELAQRNFGLARELVHEANELGAGYVNDEHKAPFARVFMSSMLEGWRKANIEGLIQRDDIDELGKGFILFCYYSQMRSLEDYMTSKAADTKEEALERVERVYEQVAQRLFGDSSPEQVNKVKEMSMQLDKEIHAGMKALGDFDISTE